ncbi:MAG: hypothetical protein ACLUTA_07380 [Blautia wexlerae]
MKKRVLIVLGILIAAGGIGTGVWYHFQGSGQSGSDDTVVYVSKVSVLTGVRISGNQSFCRCGRTAGNGKCKDRKRT